MVGEDDAEGPEEPEIVAELGLNGQIMRRILQAGAHPPFLRDSSAPFLSPLQICVRTVPEPCRSKSAGSPSASSIVKGMPSPRDFP